MFAGVLGGTVSGPSDTEKPHSLGWLDESEIPSWRRSIKVSAGGLCGGLIWNMYWGDWKFLSTVVNVHIYRHNGGAIEDAPYISWYRIVFDVCGVSRDPLIGPP